MPRPGTTWDSRSWTGFRGGGGGGCRRVPAGRGNLGWPAARLVVIHDDLDLPLGRLRVSARAGPGGHLGVTSIQTVLGTRAFPRVRVGIGRPREGQEAAT